MEWKVAQIRYLDIKTPFGNDSHKADRYKAMILSEYTLSDILNLKFNMQDKFRPGKTIKEWIEVDVKRQLKEYIEGPEVKQLVKGGSVLHATIVVVIGSRHILSWNMENGLLVTPVLLGGREVPKKIISNAEPVPKNSIER